MTKPKDDLEAVRLIAEILDGFSNDEQERIIRWARERLGMPAQDTAPSPKQPVVEVATRSVSEPQDIRSLVAQKDPKNDSQLAAVVAYYHQLVAPEPQRKDSVGSDDIIEACRAAGRARPQRPAQTLVNAFHDGLLDRADRGQYRLNAVGENLVAMVLPDQNAESGRAATKRRKSKKKKAKKKSARQKRQPKRRKRQKA